jgi:hypothetical protein
VTGALVQIVPAVPAAFERRYECIDCALGLARRLEAEAMRDHMFAHVAAGHTLPLGMLDKVDAEARALELR